MTMMLERSTRLGRRILASAACVLLAGCSGILDVDNPNNLQEDDLGSPSTARALAAGAGATVARAYGAMLGPYSTVGDEVVWIGSRDAWFQLDIGSIADPANEFTDDAFRFVGEARWMADEAIKRLEDFDAANQLLDLRGVPDRNPLARAYLYGAIARMLIGDMFDDFALSDRREPSPPLGPQNMRQMYDTAIDYLTKGLAVAQATGNVTLQNQIMATRARAHYSRALWDKLNPAGQIPSNPLVQDAGANAEAQAVLLRVGSDFRYALALDTPDIAYAGEVSLAYNLNQRRELAIAPAYRTLQDPIDNVLDPAVQAELARLTANYVYHPVTIATAREMRLILAESALAQADLLGFATHINAIRSLDGLTPWAGQIPALAMLQHARRANLFIQGRRLADMYRFGVQSPRWSQSPPATTIQTPGTFFPITCIEIRSHPQDFAGVSC